MKALSVISNYKYQDAVEQSCKAIAPTWPLDQMIAVNPLWKQINQPFKDVSAKLSALGKISCLMPASYYLKKWQAGEILEQDLPTDYPKEKLLSALQPSSDKPLANWHNISDLLDSQRDQQHNMAWRDEITHQISQFCALYFQSLDISLATTQASLYQRWLEMTVVDNGIELLMDSPKLMSQFKTLPKDATELIELALDELDVPTQTAQNYLHALLLDINGWAAWVAYLEWQADLHHQPVKIMHELLAIRLAWDLILWRYYQSDNPFTSDVLQSYWDQEWSNLDNLIDQHRQHQAILWQWQSALEFSYQRRLENQLLSAPQNIENTQPRPALQAAFCIDVRSEVIRRALEQQNTGIQTLGFAGFFGLPIRYQVAGSHFKRPQLPGLLAPQITVSEALNQNQQNKRNHRFTQAAHQQSWARNGVASFSMVESQGIQYLFKLLKQSFFPAAHAHPINSLSNQAELRLEASQQALPLKTKVDLAANILKSMALTQTFAPHVLLVGHGSHTTNNTHAAGLDCGACGGQTGEINARVLAALLNEQAVRTELKDEDIHIPNDTVFVPALHNTTTDQITVFDHALPSQINDWLHKAQSASQQERAPKLGITAKSNKSLGSILEHISHDWSQVRQEWGLANNAAFIIAPRNRTKHFSLEGRCFLHEYVWQKDTEFKILEAIMTAPMVVTHWINSQYNASMADTLKYGAGNKILHNVVGGHIGVFEGNGGDLRIGLARQSLHNGEQWMHTLQRLSVYIDAPKPAISAIVEKHPTIKNLVDNEWLYLHCLPQDNQSIERYINAQWQAKQTAG